LSQELVTYIVLGSKSRLHGVKLPSNNKFEEYLPLSFDLKVNILKKLDKLITSSQGELIVLLPPSCHPNNFAKEQLKNIALIGLSSWGWFQYNSKRKNLVQNIKRVNTLIRSTPEKDYIFQSEVLVLWNQPSSQKYQKDYILELIHKNPYQHL
jgi:hypothetical protein